mmetsp:Transcript_29668/g.95309  ORF Transcript_29668/g.95309 Transcript_29668/m.95309 type:complete len:146 (+) Transcript_29668:376-813(+)
MSSTVATSLAASRAPCSAPRASVARRSVVAATRASNGASTAKLSSRRMLSLGLGFAAGTAITVPGRKGVAVAGTPQEEQMAQVRAAQEDQMRKTAEAAKKQADAVKQQQAAAVGRAQAQQAKDVAKAEADQEKLKQFFKKVLGWD